MRTDVSYEITRTDVALFGAKEHQVEGVEETAVEQNISFYTWLVLCYLFIKSNVKRNFSKI